MSTLMEQREAAYKRAARLTEQAQTDESFYIAARAALDEVKSIDVKIEKARRSKGAEVLAFFDSGPDAAYGSMSSGGHLDFKDLGRRMATEMTVYSNRLGQFKGLVASGSTALDVPVQNTVPIPGGAGQETPPRLLDHLPVAVRSAPVYSFLRQAVIASPGGASVVAPGDLKPTMKLGVARTDSRLRVLAVLSEPVDKFLLEDAANLAIWVGVELGSALQTALETEVLTGDGTGEHFTGLSHASGIQLQPYAADRIVTVQAGLSKLESIGVPPVFAALSAADWLAIQTQRTANGSFDIGGPIDVTARTVWGCPVVVVPGLTAGVGYIVGQDAVTLSTDNSGVRIEWGTPGDSFTRNQIVARCEGRFNLDVVKPHGIVSLDLTA